MTKFGGFFLDIFKSQSHSEGLGLGKSMQGGAGGDWAGANLQPPWVTALYCPGI